MLNPVQMGPQVFPVPVALWAFYMLPRAIGTFLALPDRTFLTRDTMLVPEVVMANSANSAQAGLLISEPGLYLQLCLRWNLSSRSFLGRGLRPGCRAALGAMALSGMCSTSLPTTLRVGASDRHGSSRSGAGNRVGALPFAWVWTLLSCGGHFSRGKRNLCVCSCCICARLAFEITIMYETCILG